MRIKIIALLTYMFRRTGSPWAPPSPPDTNSSATMSPVYPDRPIRPLPKRSLRERLSPEAADSISYPPGPVNSTLFYTSYAEAMAQSSGTVVKNAIKEIDKQLVNDHDHGDGNEGTRTKGYQFRGQDVESEDDLLGSRRHRVQNQKGKMVPGSRPTVNGTLHVREIPQSASSNDSVDGYDSFENTNNKKKRKIPTSGGLSNHHATSLSSELANMGISNGDVGSQDGSDGGISQYYGTGSSAMPAVHGGTGISGAGRGRYGRSGRRDASGRSPLGVSLNGTNGWHPLRAGGSKKDYVPAPNVRGR